MTQKHKIYLYLWGSIMKKILVFGSWFLVLGSLFFVFFFVLWYLIIVLCSFLNVLHSLLVIVTTKPCCFKGDMRPKTTKGDVWGREFIKNFERKLFLNSIRKAKEEGDFQKVMETEDIDEAVDHFTKVYSKILDEHAPIKLFKSIRTTAFI